MKILLLCLCFLLCACQQSFEKGNIHFPTLSNEIISLCEYPLTNDPSFLLDHYESELQLLEDNLILVSPFSYPQEVIIIIPSNDKKWISFFEQYQKDLIKESSHITSSKKYYENAKIGQIHQYTYLIVSQHGDKILDYLLSK